MVILTTFSLAEAVVINIGTYCSLAAGLLYLLISAPFFYWPLVTRYPDEWCSLTVPWYMMSPGLVAASLPLLNSESLPPPSEITPEICKIECEAIYAADFLTLNQIRAFIIMPGPKGQPI
ncbi:hypothetical protein DSO57_1020933 [Entomophthora muscae]|uniref:Uncharacterized protein n=1 Tax=Entomophthora muscae TaxID=34485 RepID=A0ACC2U1U6_9FUNG|nr:hypothetical protein DSO57_1020933 [Entomophthora muscae]